MMPLLQARFLISHGPSSALVHWKATVPFAHIFSRTNRLHEGSKANWDYRSSLTGSCAFCRVRVLAMDNSIKEAISTMKPKLIFISILAVLFVFPLMGTFAQQSPNSVSIEVITTFDYPGSGNLTLPQKINERGDIVVELIDSNGVTRCIGRFSNAGFSVT